VADLERFSITADADALYLLAEMGSGGGSPPPMLQVAIDLDRVAASGQTFFGGFADTSVASDAAWEYLVQTRFGSGSGMPFVYDASFVDQAGAGASNVLGGGGVIEVRVPWSTLGLGGGPTGPVRFTVATFRAAVNDDTLDLFGASDALDALTHYGDPAGSGSTNTFSEVSDGVVDHHFDVFFHLDPQLDPSAPLLISEIGYDTSGGSSEEWIEVVNRSGGTVDLSGHALSSEATVGGSDVSAAFPGGASIASGAFAVVASNGTSFASAQSTAADFEITDSAPGIVDMAASSGWSMGSTLVLANGGDEVLLLDPFLTVLDAVTYEAGSYPGVTPAAGSSVDETIARNPSTKDTDDGSVDFVAGAATPGAGPAASAVPLLSLPSQIALLLVVVGLATRAKHSIVERASGPSSGDDARQ
jgi:hypothetical protein